MDRTVPEVYIRIGPPAREKAVGWMNNTAWTNGSKPPTTQEKKYNRKNATHIHVVKVQGEDLATPGCLKEVRVRWCVGDFHSWVRAPLIMKKPRDSKLVPEYWF